MNSPPPAWSRRRLWVFRTGVAFFLVQIAVSLLDASPATRALGARLEAIASYPFRAWTPALAEWFRATWQRSDGHAVALQLAREGLLALGLAALWSALDRRPAHVRLAGVQRVLLRYMTGCVLAVYGGFKVVPVQFRPPGAEELLRPLGEFTPMGLVWAFVGSSPAYTVFGGILELTGAALLFWRRTTTLGALILVGVMSHVTVLNFAYDISVKHAAALLLVAALVLASRDAGALLDLLVRSRPARTSPEPAFAGGSVARRTRAVLKPLIVTAALVGPVAGALALGPRWTNVPLEGLYAVERHELDGVELQAALSQPERWRRIVVGDRGGVVVQRMDGRCERFELALDPLSDALTLTPVRAGPPLRFVHEEQGERSSWTGIGAGAPHLRLRREDPGQVFRLLR